MKRGGEGRRGKGKGGEGRRWKGKGGEGRGRTTAQILSWLWAYSVRHETPRKNYGIELPSVDP